MHPRSAAALLLVTAILFVIAVATEIFIEDVLRPRTYFGYLLGTTALTGVVASLVIEKSGAKMLD